MSGFSLYVALQLPARARLDLLTARERLPEAVPGLDYSTPEDWHITLAFLGRRECDARPVLTRLSRKYAPISLRLEGAGRFGSAVLWTGVGGQVDELVTLAHSLRTELDADTTYDYAPHVTLGVSKDGSADLDPLIARFASYRGPTWVADRICLMCSHPGVAVDDLVGRWPLGGSVR